MTKRNLYEFLLAVVASVSVVIPAVAHHSVTAEFDPGKEFTVTGVLTKVLWVNPHVYWFLDVKDDKGNVVHWVCETASPEALKLINWSKASIAPGDVITVYLYPSKNGNPAGRLNKIVLADGTTLHDTQLGGDAGNKSRYDPDADTNKK